MSPDSRGERLQIMLSAEELQVIDEFRFGQHMPSRAAAVRELLKRGLAAEGFAAAVDMGYDMIRYELLSRIGQSMARDLQARANAQMATEPVASGVAS